MAAEAVLKCTLDRLVGGPKGFPWSFTALSWKSIGKRLEGTRITTATILDYALERPEIKMLPTLGMMWVERQAIRTSECNVLLRIRPTEHDIMS